MRFVSFLSYGFITAIEVNPSERKLAKRTSVDCVLKCSLCGHQKSRNQNGTAYVKYVIFMADSKSKGCLIIVKSFNIWWSSTQTWFCFGNLFVLVEIGFRLEMVFNSKLRLLHSVVPRTVGKFYNSPLGYLVHKMLTKIMYLHGLHSKIEIKGT